MNPAAKTAKEKKFALQCREMRLFIAKNPGVNSFFLKDHFGYTPYRHLSKMARMGIIKEEGGTGALDGLFYVVPQ